MVDTSHVFKIIDHDPTEQARGVVTAEEWNTILLLLKDQGNDSAKQLQDLFGDIYTQTQLASSSVGQDGARLIGIDPIPGITGTNVNEAFRSLKEQIDTTVLGSIPDAAITSAKLAANLNFTGTVLTFNSTNILTASDIKDNLITDSASFAASARQVKLLNDTKQDKIKVDITEPTLATSGTIYLQYLQ